MGGYPQVTTLTEMRNKYIPTETERTETEAQRNSERDRDTEKKV